MALFDVGGNVGMASLFLTKEYGDKIKQHIAVEPIKKNAVLFRKNNPKVDLCVAGVVKDARTKSSTVAVPNSQRGGGGGFPP